MMLTYNRKHFQGAASLRDNYLGLPLNAPM
jgi:hypothetical protein